jgi:hypothetical protein
MHNLLAGYQALGHLPNSFEHVRRTGLVIMALTRAARGTRNRDDTLAPSNKCSARTDPAPWLCAVFPPVSSAAALGTVPRLTVQRCVEPSDQPTRYHSRYHALRTPCRVVHGLRTQTVRCLPCPAHPRIGGTARWCRCGQRRCWWGDGAAVGGGEADPPTQILHPAVMAMAIDAPAAACTVEVCPGWLQYLLGLLAARHP